MYVLEINYSRCKQVSGQKNKYFPTCGARWYLAYVLDFRDFSSPLFKVSREPIPLWGALSWHVAWGPFYFEPIKGRVSHELCRIKIGGMSASFLGYLPSVPASLNLGKKTAALQLIGRRWPYIETDMYCTVLYCIVHTCWVWAMQ